MLLSGDIISLDLGKSRTGVARISTFAGIAEPLSLIQMTTDDLYSRVEKLVKEHSAVAVCVGLPRGLDGQDTEQTLWSSAIFQQLQSELDVPMFQIDEAGTSKRAEEIRRPDQSIDSVAAGIIAEDFLREIQLGRVADVSV